METWNLEVGAKDTNELHQKRKTLYTIANIFSVGQRYRANDDIVNQGRVLFFCYYPLDVFCLKVLQMIAVS